MTTKNKLSNLEDLPVGTIVARQPALARVFEKYRIDYCCQGNKKLCQACADQNLDLEQVSAELEAASSSPEIQATWLEKSLTALCDHIERRHHDYLKQELPRIAGLITKVVNAHGATHPELAEVDQHFQTLRNELDPHMMKEEKVLFPAIRQMEQTKTRQHFAFGSVENPIRCMVVEHNDAGQELAILRRLNQDYVAQADTCTTWQLMLDSLLKLEQDMHEHVHKENAILFPRAQQLEQQLAGKSESPSIGV
jgi:regulator of cell morphogenesis and NO signaling